MQYLEAMASGIPVIACDWGAQADYLNVSNSFPVKSFLKVIDDPNYIVKCPQALNNRWCQVHIDDLCQTMRYVYDNRAEASKKAEIALIQARGMTWQKTAISFINRVITMYDKIGKMEEVKL